MKKIIPFIIILLMSDFSYGCILSENNKSISDIKPFELCKLSKSRHNYFYDITGNVIAVDTTKPLLVVAYSNTCCHNCMRVLVEYCRSHPEYTLCVIVDGASVAERRAKTMSLSDYFDTLPLVLYDLNPKQRNRYFRKYHIAEEVPCLLIFQTDGTCVYIPYRKLFANGEFDSSLLPRLKSKSN